MNRGGVPAYDFDQIGNLWTVNPATGKNQLSYQDMTAFGTLTAGSPATSPYQFSGGNGCQTDSDSGLVLMGHRYMDTRTGRFISQDPAGDGNNWYAYADNSPANAIDPSGLVMMFDPSKSDMQPSGPNIMSDYNNGQSGTYDFFKSDGNGGWKYTGTDTIGPNVVSMMMQGGLGMTMRPGGMGGLDGQAFMAHTKGARPSTKGDHENGMARACYALWNSRDSFLLIKPISLLASDFATGVDRWSPMPYLVLYRAYRPFWDFKVHNRL